MKKNLKRILPWILSAGAAVSPLEKIAAQNNYSQPLSSPLVSVPLVPGRLAKEQGEIYNFSGKIRNVLDSTAIADAELTFTSPEGNQYKTTTNGNGEYTTSIDTYVEIRNPDDILNETAVSAPLKNPTGGRTAFVVNIPKPTTAKFKVYNILGQELTDVVDGPIDGNIGRGQYQLDVDMNGKATPKEEGLCRLLNSRRYLYFGLWSWPAVCFHRSRWKAW
jgi:hypothetical protein